MNPLAISAATALVAFCAGFWVDHQWMSAKLTEIELANSRAVEKYRQENMAKLQEAEANVRAFETRSKTALRRALDAPKQPLNCPASGELRDVVIPGLSQRLRDIFSSGQADGAAVEVVPD